MFGLSKRMLIVIGVLVLVVVLYAIQNSRNSSAQQQQQSTGQCQVQVSADVLNVRSGPQDNAPVVGKLTSGKVTPAEKTVQNGYRRLGNDRWVSNQFVKPVSGAC